MELDHFSHGHLLILQEEVKENDDEVVICYGCDRPIFMGPYYSCGECKYFMHTTCAELPREMQHWMHPNHPLTLIVLQERWSCRCDACGHPIRNITYNCSICKFDLDLRCITLPITIQHCAHEHPFTLVTKRVEFYCDACGAKSNGMSYLCFACQLFVHLECASLPGVIKLSDHIHNLTLTYSILGNHFSGNCRFCQKKVKTRGVYHCADCSYVAHVGCTLSKRKREKVRERQTGTEIVIGSASLPAVAKHYGHDHPLRIMLNEAEFSCDACGEKAEGSFSYICPRCQFWVHSECASLPMSFCSTHNHDLLTLDCSFKLNDSTVCALCNERVKPNVWTYCCADGDYLAHVHCSKEIIRNSGIVLVPSVDHHDDPDSYFLPDVHEPIYFINEIDFEKLSGPGGEEVPRELKHFSHRHCLTLCESMENDGKCHGCAEHLSGPSYTCAKCGYFLHKSCAELPREILEHPLHPQHPLTLFANPPYTLAYCLCDACNQPVRHFVYHCSLCKFNLDVRCVSRPCMVQHLGHDHPLTLLQKRANYSCYACGMEGSGLSYLCTTCLVLFHLECASSPNVIKLNNHDHSFRICLTADSNHPNKAFCVICNDRVKFDHWYYFCEELHCSFAAHLRCATSKGKRPSRNTPLDPFPILDESIFLTNDDVSTNDETIRTELSHFSHPHCLTLSFDELKTGEQCNGCTQPISGSFYSCSECSFFLHKSCTQLRCEIRHPLHIEHRLKVLAKHPFTLDGLFWCDMCRLLCSGFTYFCEYCNFQIDIVCSSILGNFKHEAHEHVLTHEPYADAAFIKHYRCRACGSGFLLPSSVLRCSDCNFALHVNCATLPQTVWHKIHRHPFALSYHFVEDDTCEYYCDICEKKQNPKQWFYNCADCDYPAHVRCMVGKHHRLKMGVTLKIEDHPHSCMLMQLKNSELEEQLKSWDWEMEEAKENREDAYTRIAFCCDQCNFIINPVRKFRSLSY